MCRDRFAQAQKENPIEATIREFDRTVETQGEAHAFSLFQSDIHAHQAELKNLFDQSLISHEHLFLHELFWFNQTRSYDAAFRASTRQSLRAALTEPTLYLGQMKAQPQTSALFQLFSDSGQLVNIYDWYQAFNEVSNDRGDDGEGRKLQQALFVRSTAELQFLGFFKSTKRKTDHVQKTFSTL